MKKNIFLALIASVCMVPAVFASLAWRDQMPSCPPDHLPEVDPTQGIVVTEGLETVLIKGEPTLKSYIYLPMDENCTLNNVVIFDSSGFERLMTLKELHSFLRGPEGVKYNTAKYAMERIEQNNAVICPAVVPQEYSAKDKFVKFFTGQEKELAPAIGTGARSCDVCKNIKKDYIEQAKQNQK